MHKDEIGVERANERLANRDDEIKSLFEAFVSAVEARINDEALSIDNMPKARNESEAEALADLRPYVRRSGLRAILSEEVPKLMMATEKIRMEED